MRTGKIVVFVGVLLLGSAPTVLGQTVRFDWPQEDDQLVGYLTSQGGVHGISWDPSSPSDDLLGPVPTDDQDRLYDQSYNLYFSTGQRGPVTPQSAYEFKSSPLPRTLHLDPRRAIEVDLFVTRYTAPYWDPCSYTQRTIVIVGTGSSTPDPFLTVDIKADGKTLGGHWRSAQIQWSPWSGSYYHPPDPAGFATCRFRFHPQMETLEKGTILTLTITPFLHSKGFQYGLGGDHRSVLRLTSYSDEEWVYRDPSTGGAGSHAAMAEQESSALAAAFPLLGTGALAMVARRRRERSLLIVLVLLAGAMGGCLGSNGSGSSGGQEEILDGNVTSTQVADQDRTLTSAGNGSIIGTVRDYDNLPLEGVHASIFGTSFFAETDKLGRFSLVNLPATTYTVRFDKKEFRSFEVQLEVKSGFVNRPEITMYPLVMEEGDQRRHRHDYWADQPSITVMDQVVPSTYFAIPPPDGPGFNSVLPGTHMMEGTISWSKSAPHQQVALWVRHNAELAAYNYTIVGLIRNGEPFSIPVAWEMADPGHQLFSTWQFQIEADPRGTRPAVGGCSPVICLVSVPSPTSTPVEYRVKFTIHRGVVPLEPEHPDYWMGGVQRGVMTGAWTSYHNPQSGPYAALCMAESKADPEYVCPYNWAYFQAPPALVPFDATWLEVYLNKTQEPSFQFQYDLRFVTALKGAEAVVGKDPIRTGLSTRYNIPLEPGWADPVYATKTAWSFSARPNDQDQANLDYANPAGQNFGLGIVVIAHKDAMP